MPVIGVFSAYGESCLCFGGLVLGLGLEDSALRLGLGLAVTADLKEVWHTVLDRIEWKKETIRVRDSNPSHFRNRRQH